MPRRTRFPQQEGKKGSQKWIQRLTRSTPAELTSLLQRSLKKPSSWVPTWTSPLDDDGRAEYRDEGFLIRLGLQHLKAELALYWPEGGPQWDALGTVPGGVLLVEAKAHFDELASSCGAARPASTAAISAALEGTKRWVGAPANADWMNGFYQYANRLAHVRFLREHGVDAHLLFVYFYGDSEMRNCPPSEADWHAALETAYSHLGVDSLPECVGSVFLDVALIPDKP